MVVISRYKNIPELYGENKGNNHFFFVLDLSLQCNGKFIHSVNITVWKLGTEDRGARDNQESSLWLD